MLIRWSEIRPYLNRHRDRSQQTHMQASAGQENTFCMSEKAFSADMEGNIMGVQFLGSSASGVLDFQHNQQSVAHLQGLSPFSSTQTMHTNPDSNQAVLPEVKGTSQASYVYGKDKIAVTSDEEELSLMEVRDDPVDKSTGAPWQRIKWTDSMVKLLLNAILFAGEDGLDIVHGNKRKQGYFQKKGKWKLVSHFMTQRGLCVSPQQCEDKFNDLNKKYKRLSVILGRLMAHVGQEHNGLTAQSIVEKPCLLDELETIPSKVKEDVKRILSSKQLFYKEMCEYYNGCKASPLDSDFQPSIYRGLSNRSQDTCLDNEAEDYDEDEEIEEQHEDGGAHPGGVDNFSVSHKNHNQTLRMPEENNSSVSLCTHTLQLESLTGKPAFLAEPGTMTTAERRLTRTRAVQLEEEKLALQSQALELEKQHFQWQRLSSKKERELTRRKLENERRELETEHMALIAKKQELEAEYARSEASMASIALILERLQSTSDNVQGNNLGMG